MDLKRSSDEKLRNVREELAKIKKEKEEAFEEANRLKAKIDKLKKKQLQCEKRLENAKNLLSNLKNEKDNWHYKIESLKSDEKNLLGDIFISSGIVAYLGAFTKSFRGEIIKKWNELIDNANIRINTNTESILQKTLSDKMEIESLKIHKLPNDNFSIDNAIIVQNSSRWCLLIDPQNQAIEWLYETYRKKRH